MIKIAGPMAAKNIDRISVITSCPLNYSVCKTHTNSSEHLSGIGDAEVISNNQPVAKESRRYGNDPHQKVWQ